LLLTGRGALPPLSGSGIFSEAFFIMLQREMIGNIAVITLDVQTLDAKNAPHLTGLLGEAMRDVNQVVLDLGPLQHFDIGGFAAILKWAAGNQADQEIRLCSASGAVHALLELLQADIIFPLYNSREDAIASLKAPRRSSAQAGRPSSQSRRSDRRSAQFVN
jgi:anti-anti-sigma factor